MFRISRTKDKGWSISSQELPALFCLALVSSPFRNRLSESGLAGLFASIFIVEHKDRTSFERVCTDLSLDLNFTWSIGDSLRSDIKPALAAGLGAFWISQATWTYENADEENHDRLIRLKSISQLPRALRKVEQSRDVHL